MVAPSIWFTRLSASTIAPQSKAGDEPRDADRSVPLDADFGAGRDVGALLHAARDSQPGSLVPARAFGRGAEDSGEPLLVEVSQPQLHGIDTEPVGKLEMRLAGKVVGGGSDATVRAGTQGRVRG